MDGGQHFHPFQTVPSVIMSSLLGDPLGPKGDRKLYGHTWISWQNFKGIHDVLFYHRYSDASTDCCQLETGPWVNFSD